MGESPFLLDRLFEINLLVGFLWLWFSVRLARAMVPFWRLLLAAILGAVLAVLVVALPGGGLLLRTPIVLLICTGLLALCLWRNSLARYLTAGLGLMAIIISSGGFTLLIAEQFVGSEAVPTWLVACAVALAGLGLQRLYEWRADRQPTERALYDLLIRLGGGDVLLSGLVDSGNGLRTPLGRQAVTIVELAPLRHLLPGEVEEAIRGGWAALETMPLAWRSRFQIIPYRAVGQLDGTLLVLSPDRLFVRRHGEADWRTISGSIGLVGQELDPQGRYQALLPARLACDAEGEQTREGMAG